MQRQFFYPKSKSLFIVTIILLSCFLILVPQIQNVYCYTGTISYSPTTNTITCVGGTSGTPIGFNDLWLADKAGTYVLVTRTGVSAIDSSPVADTNALRPSDLVVLGKTKLYFTITSFTGLTSTTINVTGTDANGNGQSELIIATGNGQYNTVNYYATVSTTQDIVFVGVGSFTYSLTQAQWGVAWKQAVDQYALDCYIAIGNGSTTTYFSDSEKQIIFSDFQGANSKILIQFTNSSTSTFGVLSDATTRSTRAGCSFIVNSSYIYNYFKGAATAVVYFYSCTFDSIKDSEGNVISTLTNGRIWNCNFVKRWYLDVLTSCDIYNIVVSRVTYPLSTFTTCTLNQAFIFNTRYGCWRGGTFKNVIIVDTLATDPYTFGQQIPTDPEGYYVNCVFDYWHASYGANCNQKNYRQYEFDLTVSNATGSSLNAEGVSITQANGSVVFNGNTNSSGQIPTQTLTYGFYNQTGGDTIYSSTYSPYTLTIVNSTGNYDNYTMQFTPLAKTLLQIALNNQYQSGWNAGNATGYSSGYTSGWDAGNTTGYNAGWSAGNSTGYVNGWASGNATGYANGYASGYSTGYGVGYSDGWSAGNSTGWISGNATGYMNGWIDGNNTGYSSGFSAGVASVTFLGNATIDTVLQGQTFYSDTHTLQTGVYTPSPLGTPDPSVYMTIDEGTSYIIIGAIIAAVVAGIVIFTLFKRRKE